MLNVDAEIVSIVVCGVGTFLLRLIPLWKEPHTTTDSSLQKGFIHQLSNAIGPAAVTSLLVAMLWPIVSTGELQRAVMMLQGMLATWAVQRLWGGIALPTLCGATVYGALAALFGAGI
jgi:branched-subunit amino acid transport protein AzlD